MYYYLIGIGLLSSCLALAPPLPTYKPKSTYELKKPEYNETYMPPAPHIIHKRNANPLKPAYIKAPPAPAPSYINPPNPVYASVSTQAQRTSPTNPDTYKQPQAVTYK